VSLIERTLFVERRFRELGMRVDASSRFGVLSRIANKLKDTDGLLVDGDPELPYMVQAVRDILETEHILKHLWLTPPSKEQKERIKRLCGDDPIPQPGAKTQGRDLQFELLVEAKCSAGGLSVQPDEATDIRCDVSGHPLGVACKRCQNEDSTVRACKAGSDQITSSGHRGVLAVDVSQVMNPEGRFLKVTDDAKSTSLVTASLSELLHKIGPRIIGVVNRDRVARAYFFVTWIRESGPMQVGLEGLTMRFQTQRGDEVLARKSLAAFDAGLCRGTPNMEF
jgi:hypothetical protein